MIKYFFKKFMRFILVLIGATILTFSLTLLVPGNPAEIILSQSGIEPTIEEIQNVEKKLGLDKPLLVRYSKWIKNAAKGDLGISYITRESVTKEIVYRVPKTLQLTMISFLLMLIIAFPIGILCAIYINGLFDNLIKGITFVFMSLPSFWIGFIFIYYFAIKLKILPVAGSESIKHIIMPTIVLAIPMASKYIRLIRISFISELEEEYVYSLRAKGFREKITIINNVMKNALIPIIPSIIMSIGALLGGSVIVENIFAWPGLGNYLVSAIMNRDFPVIQGYVLLMGIVFVTLNFLADILTKFLNPKISFKKEGVI